MNRRHDEGKYISWRDVLENWRAFEREYTVHLTLRGRILVCKRNGVAFGYTLEATVPNGPKPDDCYARCDFSFPCREYGSITGALVGTLHRLGTQIEWKREELSKAQQGRLFDGAQ